MSRPGKAVTRGTAAGLPGGALAILLALTGAAAAFPFVDPTNQDNLPTGAPVGTDLPAQDVHGLGAQMRLVNPAAPGNPSAWTIIPRLTLQEMFTDNAYEVTAPRSADAITIVAPGISIAADTARLKLSLDYQPNLIMHAINGPLNVLTQQLNAVGLVTVVPDIAYVDVRAFSGVQSTLGALAGAGTIGAGNIGLGSNIGTQTATGATGTGQALNRNNEVQTSSFGISPYLIGQFGDYGSGKLGVSANAARYSTIKGFAASPFPTGGSAGSNLLTTEELAHFTSGQFLSKLQYMFDLDVSQSHTVTQAGTVNIGTTQVAIPPGTFDSRRESVTNQLSYALNHAFTVLGSIGYQKIEYGGLAGANIAGLTWNAGFTYAPGPYTSITITYGRQNGTDAFQANGNVALGTRSTLTFGYSNTVGTQLENLQNQLNAAAINTAGALVNAPNGGPVFIANNALGVQNGVFRFNTFNATLTTLWDRDTFQESLTWAEQTSITPGVATVITLVPGLGSVVTPTATTLTGPTTVVATAGITWTHLLSPDTTVTSSAVFSNTRRNAGLDDNSLSTAVALQYTLSPSTTLTARYSFFDRVSKIPGYSLYENILLLGLTKQF